MARQIPDSDLAAIEQAVRAHPEGLPAPQIARELAAPPPPRTLQYRLRQLVLRGRIHKDGDGRWARYRLPEPAPTTAIAAPFTPDALPLSAAGREIQQHIRQPIAARQPVGYRRDFLDAYRPNESAYLSEAERAHLARIGATEAGAEPAGTYARQILNRLLIDLAWNSSRLEGNTYSLLDTQRLIERGEEADGRAQTETQMILNHKDAIEFLVGAADDIGFNRYTILNLHAMLANNLLHDPAAAGRLRHIAVGIEGSTFLPLEAPQLIQECFDQVLATAAAIHDPFEQSFFVMVQLPYLQPFDDVNKRVSRLAANIPLIRGNLAPLSFADVPKALYTEAMIGVYELNRTELLRDVFVWAYERSVARHSAVRQSLGDPDPFRFRYRTELREVIGAVIRGRMNRKAAAAHIASWSAEKIGPDERSRFAEVTQAELRSLHEGNFARYQVRPSEFAAWQQAWNATRPAATRRAQAAGTNR